MKTIPLQELVHGQFWQLRGLQQAVDNPDYAVGVDDVDAHALNELNFDTFVKEKELAEAGVLKGPGAKSLDEQMEENRQKYVTGTLPVLRGPVSREFLETLHEACKYFLDHATEFKTYDSAAVQVDSIEIKLPYFDHFMPEGDTQFPWLNDDSGEGIHFRGKLGEQGYEIILTTNRDAIYNMLSSVGGTLEDLDHMKATIPFAFQLKTYEPQGVPLSDVFIAGYDDDPLVKDLMHLQRSITEYCMEQEQRAE